MNMRKAEPLSRHTTLRTGGPARFFLEVRTEDEIREGLEFARSEGIPVFALGGGSNVLASDGGFGGLVMKMANRGMRAEEVAEGVTEAVFAAGESWDDAVAFAVERGLGGLENMSLIPGTVGAAVIGNIGAYGSEVKDSLIWAEALDIRTGVARRFTTAECACGYRWSYFKTAVGRNYFVTRAGFALRRGKPVNLRYRDVAEYFSSRGIVEPSRTAVRDAVIAIRRRKLPDVAVVGTAGSFFKNPIISKPEYDAVAVRYPGLPGHDEGSERVKLSLGWILDRICHLKGVRRGPVGTHPDQALVIVNDGGTTEQIEGLANEMAAAVRNATGIEVEWEVEKVEEIRNSTHMMNP